MIRVSLDPAPFMLSLFDQWYSCRFGTNQSLEDYVAEVWLNLNYCVADWE